jgi:hypothetical protein
MVIHAGTLDASSSCSPTLLFSQTVSPAFGFTATACLNLDNP